MRMLCFEKVTGKPGYFTIHFYFVDHESITMAGCCTAPDGKVTHMKNVTISDGYIDLAWFELALNSISDAASIPGCHGLSCLWRSHDFYPAALQFRSVTCMVEMRVGNE
jgi:hypothetical protein